MDQAYHPGFGGIVNYSIRALPEAPDGQVRETINEALNLIRADVQAPIIQDHAFRCLKLGQGAGTYAQQAIRGVFRHVKSKMRFQHDEDTAQALQIDDPRKRDIIEVLIRPVDQAMLIDRMGQGFEDCDGFETYAGCVLTALGIPVSLVTVSAEPREPGVYSHVYLACYADGERIPVDFSHGPYPGWECPNTGRLKEWPVTPSFAAQLFDAIVPVGVAIALYAALKWGRVAQ